MESFPQSKIIFKFTTISLFVFRNKIPALVYSKADQTVQVGGLTGSDPSGQTGPSPLSHTGVVPSLQIPFLAQDPSAHDGLELSPQDGLPSLQGFVGFAGVDPSAQVLGS